MMPVIPLTLPIWALFWKISSFLIDLQIRLPWTGRSKPDDPAFHHL
jgi:hypothetical protein